MMIAGIASHARQRPSFYQPPGSDDDEMGNLPGVNDSGEEAREGLLAQPATQSGWRKRCDYLRCLFVPRRVLRYVVVAAGVLVVVLLAKDIVDYKRTGNSRLGGHLGHEKTKGVQVQLRQGVYRGTESVVGGHEIEAWKGIPYAETTGGDNRWRPPVRIQAETSEVFDAKEMGKACLAGSHKDGKSGGEDCLNINIWRQKGVDYKKKVPVAVFLHGGAFNFGSGDSRRMDSFVRWSVEPMIGVTISYRIGALGWLSGNFSAEEGALNLGMKDIWLALEWIQANIEQFGGDEDAVTVWGLSAGAHAVGHLLMMNLDQKPPFHRALMESGGPTARLCMPYDAPLLEAQLSEFLKALGADNIPDKDKMVYLRSLPAQKVVDASEAVYFKYDHAVRWPWQPVIDGPGGVIPKAPIESWKANEYHKVPILTGFNTDEGTVFVNHNAETSKDFEDFFKTLLPHLNETDIAELNALYPDPAKDSKSPYIDTRPANLGLGKQYKRLARAYGDYAYISPVRQTAYEAASHNRPDDQPVWLYHFDANQSVTLGAAHGDSTHYIEMNGDRTGLGGMQEGIAIQMHAYFTSFVLSGDVNAVRKAPADNRTPWPRYGVKGSSAIMVFGEGNDEMAGGTTRGGLTEVRADMWQDVEGKWWWERTILSES